MRMKKSEYIIKSLTHALGVVAYVSALALLMANTKSMTGESPALFIPVFMLLLFIISATVTSLLVLGKPISLYLNGFKREALILLFSTLGWLVFFLVGVGVVLLLSF